MRTLILMAAFALFLLPACGEETTDNNADATTTPHVDDATDHGDDDDSIDDMEHGGGADHDADEPAQKVSAGPMGRDRMSIAPDWPEEVDGCSCIYHVKGEGKKDYIFMTDYGAQAIIWVDGQKVVMTLTNQDPNVEQIQPQIWHGEDFELETNTQQIHRSGDELWDYEGTLILRENGETIVNLPIEGECGC